MVSTQIACLKLGSEVGGGVRYRMWREFFRAKSQRFGADNGDVCGCRDPLEGIVVATLDALGLRVKTLDPCGLGGGGALRRDLLGGTVVELRFP